MKPLTMTESEIRMRYRDGASAQILADLNACGWDRIKTIVGEPVEAKGKVHHGHIDEKRARDLHAEGKTDKEMSIELGVSRGAVALWRSRRGFEANKKEEIMIKETEPTEQDEPTETEMFFADVTPVPGKIQMTPNSVDLIDSAKRTSEVGCSRLTPNIYDVISAIVSGRTEPIPCVTLEPREQWEARRKDAIRIALVDALSKGGVLPAEWVIEWNERCEG